MRKFWIWLMILALLCPFGASAAEGPPCIALAVIGGDANMPREIAARGAQATFFLDVPRWEQGRRILDAGHEIGLTAPENWNQLSRRQVFRELSARRGLLPPCRVQILLPVGRTSDGVRQVAQAQGMYLLTNTVNPWMDVPLGQSFLERIKPGDILLLDGKNPALNLNLIDLLQSRGYRLVTVSDLIRFDRW